MEPLAQGHPPGVTIHPALSHAGAAAQVWKGLGRVLRVSWWYLQY